MLTKLYKLAEANNRTWLHVPSGTYCSPVEISAKKLEYKSINAIPHRINNIIIHALFNTEIWFCFYPHLLYLFQGILNRRRPLSISDFFIIKCNKLWSGVVRICTFFFSFWALFDKHTYICICVISLSRPWFLWKKIRFASITIQFPITSLIKYSYSSIRLYFYRKLTQPNALCACLDKPK